MLPENDGKNEFSELKLMSQRRFLQSIVFDKINSSGTMRDFFSAPRKINLACTVNRYIGSPTVLTKVLKKSV